MFVGISSNDYGRLALADAEACDLHSGTGNALSLSANRLSYVLDLVGPSLAIDTACSSSLVAVHLACRSLQSGECSLALAGGVNLILSQTITSAFAQARFLAPDGRCKAFDARADGYVRGEGAGSAVLKPLSARWPLGTGSMPILRGTATNQDGRSNGLTAPNPKSQQAVVRAAYRLAGISPSQVHYIEAHGTGTALGDPIEVRALGSVLAEGRDAGRRCLIGSVKSNIGHLESAAGIAGLIKTALMLHHRTMVPSLHFEQPNPLIPFDELPIEVARQCGVWQGPAECGMALQSRPDRAGSPDLLVAGVSSFGFGGTNAHAVLVSARSPSPTEDEPDGQPAALVLPLSAKTPEALCALAIAWRDHLRTRVRTAAGFRDHCFTAALRRDHHRYRLALVARSATECAEQLDRWIEGKQSCSRTRKNLDRFTEGQLSETGDAAAPTEDGPVSDCHRLARVYEAGGDVFWAALYGTARAMCAAAYVSVATPAVLDRSPAR